MISGWITAGRPAVLLRPRTDTEDFAWPPRIAEVLPDVVALWRDVADRVNHPAARARFNDLLFERRDGVGRDRAVAAGTAYLAAARSRQRADLDVAAFLVRAWDLARRVGAWALLADSCSELIKRADAEMSGGPAAPGVVLPMLAAVAAKPVRSQVKQAPETIPDPAAVGRLLDTAFATFKDGYLASQIASLMRARTDDPAEAAQIDRREVTAYLDEADASSGMRGNPTSRTPSASPGHAGSRSWQGRPPPAPGNSREGPRPEEVFLVDPRATRPDRTLPRRIHGEHRLA